MSPGRINAALLALAVTFGSGQNVGAPAPDDPRVLFMDRVLSGGAGSFRETQRTWEFRFPEDHGAHPRFRTESWLFYGHLNDEQGREFAFHLGFYRLALSATRASSVSAWSTNEVYRAYFSLTDAGGSRFFADERFARAALGLSGSKSSPTKVWVEDWFFEVQEHPAALAIALLAARDEVSVSLEMQAVKSLHLQGG